MPIIGVVCSWGAECPQPIAFLGGPAAEDGHRKGREERWDVKTLSDPAAGEVKLDPSDIKKISVKTLRLKKKPANPPGKPGARISPVRDDCLRGRSCADRRPLGLRPVAWDSDEEERRPRHPPRDRRSQQSQPDDDRRVSRPGLRRCGTRGEEDDPGCSQRLPRLRRSNAVLEQAVQAASRDCNDQRTWFLRQAARDRARPRWDRTAPRPLLQQLRLPLTPTTALQTGNGNPRCAGERKQG
jgi:hypothetical protein